MHPQLVSDTIPDQIRHIPCSESFDSSSALATPTPLSLCVRRLMIWGMEVPRNRRSSAAYRVSDTITDVTGLRTLLRELQQHIYRKRTNLTVVIHEKVDDLWDGGPNEPTELSYKVCQ